MATASTTTVTQHCLAFGTDDEVWVLFYALYNYVGSNDFYSSSEVRQAAARHLLEIADEWTDKL